MDTMRLTALPQPSLVRKVLGHDAAACCGIPADAERIDSSDRLPRLLESVVRRVEHQDGQWLAFESGWNTWLLAGEFVLDLSREYGRPVVRVTAYDADGHVRETFSLILRRQAEWSRLQQ